MSQNLVINSSRHSEAHSPSTKKLQKTRRSARFFCNIEDTFNANENSSEPKESSIVGRHCYADTKQRWLENYLSLVIIYDMFPL